MDARNDEEQVSRNVAETGAAVDHVPRRDGQQDASHECEDPISGQLLHQQVSREDREDTVDCGGESYRQLGQAEQGDQWNLGVDVDRKLVLAERAEEVR